MDRPYDVFSKVWLHEAVTIRHGVKPGP